MNLALSSASARRVPGEEEGEEGEAGEAGEAGEEARGVLGGELICCTTVLVSVRSFDPSSGETQEGVEG